MEAFNASGSYPLATPDAVLDLPELIMVSLNWLTASPDYMFSMAALDW